MRSISERAAPRPWVSTAHESDALAAGISHAGKLWPSGVVMVTSCESRPACSGSSQTSRVSPNEDPASGRSPTTSRIGRVRAPSAISLTGPATTRDSPTTSPTTALSKVVESRFSPSATTVISPPLPLPLIARTCPVCSEAAS